MENEEKALIPPLLTYYSRTTTLGINYLNFLNGLLKEVFESNKNKFSLNIRIWTPDYPIEENSDPKKPVPMLLMDLHNTWKKEVIEDIYKKVHSAIKTMSCDYGIALKYAGKVSESDLDIWIYYHFTHDMLSELRKNYEGVNRKEKIIVIAYLTSRECIIKEIQGFKVDFLCVDSPVKKSLKLVPNPSDLTEGIFNDLCGSEKNEIFNYFSLYRFLKIIKDNRRKADKEFIEKNFDENILTGEKINRLKPEQYDQYISLLKQFKYNKGLIEVFAESGGLVERKGKFFVLTDKGREYLEALRKALDDFCGKSDEYRGIWELIKEEKPVILYAKGIRSKGEPKKFQSHL